MGSLIQASTLFYLINLKLENKLSLAFVAPILKSIAATFVSGGVMFFILKIFDRSVWIKRLSFLGKIEATRNMQFESFVLDTRYTVNLMVLTFMVSAVGLLVYLTCSILLKSKEVYVFFNLIKRVFIKHKVAQIPQKEEEPLTPTSIDTSN
jgi:hypothetical protein